VGTRCAPPSPPAVRQLPPIASPCRILSPLLGEADGSLGGVLMREGNLLDVQNLALDGKRGALIGGAVVTRHDVSTTEEPPFLHVEGPSESVFAVPDPSCLHLGALSGFASIQVRSTKRVRFAAVGGFPDGTNHCVLYSTDALPPSPWNESWHHYLIHQQHANGAWYTFPLNLVKDFARWSGTEEEVPRLLHFAFWPEMDVAEVRVGGSYEVVTAGLPTIAWWHWSDPPPTPEGAADLIPTCDVSGRRSGTEDALTREGSLAGGEDGHPGLSRPSGTDAISRAEQIRSSVSIGILTALPHEYAAVELMLENPVEWSAPGEGAGRRSLLDEIPSDHGGTHAVAVVLLPDMGNNSAAIAATQLLGHFPNVRHLIVCGIAGGVPRPGETEHDVRLGDIVVSNHNGVVQYDLVKEKLNARVEHRHRPRPPGAELLEAVQYLRAEENLSRRPWEAHLSVGAKMRNGQRPPDNQDAQGQPIEYQPDPQRRPGLPRVFHGTIAAANTLLKNPEHRDYLGRQFDVKAVEMESSGIADAAWLSGRAGYLVIRGICDFCDANKGDVWQGAAAVAAAAYTRALITSMHTQSVEVRTFTDVGRVGSSADVDTIHCSGLVGIGLGIVLDGSLNSLSDESWTISIQGFKLGSERDLAAFIERFSTLPPVERYIVSEYLGVARPFAAPPTLLGNEVEVPLGMRREKENVQRLGMSLKMENGDLALGPDGDFAWISGIEATAQRIERSLGVLLGEIRGRPTYGSRCAHFFHEGTTPALLEKLIVLEIARLAAVRDDEGPALPFIEAVRRVRVPSRNLSDKRLEASVDLDLAGHGPWTGVLRIFVGDGTEVPRHGGVHDHGPSLPSSPVRRTPDTDAAWADVLRLRDVGTVYLKVDSDPVAAVQPLLEALDLAEEHCLDELGHRTQMNQIRLKAWIASAEAAIRGMSVKFLSKATSIVPDDPTLKALVDDSDYYDEGWIRFGQFVHAAAEYCLGGAPGDAALFEKARQLHVIATSPHYMEKEELRERADQYWRWKVEFDHWTKHAEDAHWPAVLRVNDPTGRQSTMVIGVNGHVRRAIPILSRGLDMNRLAAIYMDIAREEVRKRPLPDVWIVSSTDSAALNKLKALAPT